MAMDCQSPAAASFSAQTPDGIGVVPNLVPEPVRDVDRQRLRGRLSKCASCAIRPGRNDVMGAFRLKKIASLFTALLGIAIAKNRASAITVT
jgi:hypothetical protein